MNFDPRFKIPLWETVYHDCLISTAHPASPSLKYSNIKTDVALTEMFYQYPPIYNLNFEFLTDNRLVQRIQFGNIQLVANYASNSYQFKEHDIPGKSILFIDENGDYNYFDPESFDY